MVGIPVDLTTLSDAQVLALRDKAYDFLLEGKTLMSWGDSGSTAGKQFTVNPVDLMNAASAELRRRDPEEYGTRRQVGTGKVDITF